MMAPLPANRVNFEPPFLRVGVDYTAKFHIKSTCLGSTPSIPGGIHLFWHQGGPLRNGPIRLSGRIFDGPQADDQCPRAPTAYVQ